MWHTLQEAATLTGRSRRTLYRDMDAGRVSYQRRPDGRRELETSELIRAYGSLRGPSRTGTAGLAQGAHDPGTPSNEAMAALQAQVAHLTVMVERLSGLFEKVVHRLEHKPEPEAGPAAPAAPAVQDSRSSKSFDDLWELVEALRPAVDSLERPPQDDRQPAAKAAKAAKAKGDKAEKGKKGKKSK